MKAPVVLMPRCCAA